jgi:hypothetical protein
MIRSPSRISISHFLSPIFYLSSFIPQNHKNHIFPSQPNHIIIHHHIGISLPKTYSNLVTINQTMGFISKLLSCFFDTSCLEDSDQYPSQGEQETYTPSPHHGSFPTSFHGSLPTPSLYNSLSTSSHPRQTYQQLWIADGANQLANKPTDNYFPGLHPVSSSVHSSFRNSSCPDTGLAFPHRRSNIYRNRTHVGTIFGDVS